MELMYGFVVAAWLIVDVGGKTWQIPFASEDACKKAEITTKAEYNKKNLRLNRQYIYCVPTGRFYMHEKNAYEK